jgi:hypothetical protein
MQGTLAITDFGWYDFLRQQPDLAEVNFWTPSSRRTFCATTRRAATQGLATARRTDLNGS